MQDKKSADFELALVGFLEERDRLKRRLVKKYGDKALDWFKK